MQDSEERDEIRTIGEDVEALAMPSSEAAAVRHDQGQLYFAKKQAELFERELALARREIELLRETQRRSLDEEDRPSRASATSDSMSRSEMSITAIASLLDYFHGNSDFYEKWQRQVQLLKTAR
jgi:hypothetical protein